jgi:uncharacterized protein (DUF362 family)
MGTVGPDSDPMVREMKEHLERFAQASGGDVRRELESLYLLALEREKLAAIGYGGAGVQARVRGLGADDEVRLIVSHALRWAAEDERSHAVLARGLLVRTGRFLTVLATFAAYCGGLVAGWSAAVLHHTTFRRAPLSNALARVAVLFGRLGGKVPETAAAALKHQSFSSFCRFQVGAERTAVLSWDHIGALLERLPDGERLSLTARRIADDERKHERFLGVLLEAFDDQDQLRQGHDAQSLRAALAQIDASFIPGQERVAQRTHVGGGGVVHVREDEAAARGDAEALEGLLEATLDATTLAPLLSRRPGSRVAIKTTFMTAYDRRDPSSHVDLHLAEGLARWLRERGASDVAYLEAPNHYDLFFSGRSVTEVARYLGFESESYRVVDTSTDQVPFTFRRGTAQDTVSATWRDADVRLVFAKMRSHPSMLVHLTTHAVESLGRRIDELLFHDRQADVETGAMMMLDALPPALVILDATHHVPDGLTGILGDPTPSHPGRIYASEDPLALDLVAARHMGIHRFPEQHALSVAFDWFDDPARDVVVDGPDSRIPGFKSPHRNDATVLLSALAYPVYAFGGDRGNLWVPRMDPDAFPLKRRKTLSETLIRPLLRFLFGFGVPPRSARS